MTAEILLERRGPLGLITLNRPQALNALNHPMVLALRAALDEWAADDAVSVVAIRGAGGKAFSAGGDIRSLWERGRVKDPSRPSFFWDEYRLNHRIGTYPKPYVALIDGIVMGGGAGLSVLGPYRVATEKTLFAMPEVGIGFFPDVGFTYVLPRLPGELGMYFALTGERVRQADTLAMGIATHATPSADIDALVEALAAGEAVEPTLARFHRDPGPGPTAPARSMIDAAFAGGSVRDVLARLDAVAGGDELAGKLAATIRTKSPMSLEIAFRQVRRGRTLSLAECLTLEFRIVSRIIEGHDFDEGVRSVIVDKDGAPRWQPASLDEVDGAAVEAHFAPLPGGDLVLT